MVRKDLLKKTGSPRIRCGARLIPACALFLWCVMPHLAAGDGASRSSDSDCSEEVFDLARQNGILAAEGFERCRRYVDGWLKQSDRRSGLIPQNLGKGRDIWNAHNSAADNYPFMVLTAALTDRPLFEGRMLEMLRAERTLCSRVGALPDTYSFSKRGFLHAEPDINRMIFGASEYIKDGLLPLTEWLGPSYWSDRMIEMLDQAWEKAPVETASGPIVSTSQEVNGEMLQILSRIYWMTGDRNYLEWAVRLGDYYLLEGHHPTRDERRLRLRDHGCEIVSGLCELYATVHHAMPEKKQAYQEPIHAMLDRILEVGRNEHGLFYNSVDPATGKHDSGISDTWGYTMNGFYTVYLIDGTEPYRDAVRDALGGLKGNYDSYRWEGSSSDGYADTIESALNLINREPVPSAVEWIDSEIKVMWRKQRADGVVEGWHGDGNFARTTIIYCLWKTQGVTIRPWRNDVVFGAVREGDRLKVSISATNEWNGRLILDRPRHKSDLKLPLDWPRINQFPEWYSVDRETNVEVEDLTAGTTLRCTGSRLHDGIRLHLTPGAAHRLTVRKAP